MFCMLLAATHTCWGVQKRDIPMRCCTIQHALQALWPASSTMHVSKMRTSSSLQFTIVPFQVCDPSQGSCNFIVLPCARHKAAACWAALCMGEASSLSPLLAILSCKSR